LAGCLADWLTNLLAFIGWLVGWTKPNLFSRSPFPRNLVVSEMEQKAQELVPQRIME